MYPDLDSARVNSLKPNRMGLLGRNCLKNFLPLNLTIVSLIEISLERGYNLAETDDVVPP